MPISERAAKPGYRLFFMPEALAEWKALDGSVREPLKKLLAKRLVQPHVPGGAPHGDLVGCYKFKLRKQGVRLVYAVEDNKLIVMVMAVDKREDSAVYQSSMARLADKAAAMAKAVAEKLAK